jgi:hypothetical protein
VVFAEKLTFFPATRNQDPVIRFHPYSRSMHLVCPESTGLSLVGSHWDTKSMNLSRILTGVLSVALLAFMVSDTLGQDQGRRGDRGGRGGPGGQRGPGGGGFGGGFPGRGGGDPMQLLRIDEVKVELEVSPTQEEALEKIAEQSRGERPDFGNFREMSDEQRQEVFAKMQKQREERAKKTRELLEEVLVPPQLERLDQLALQLRGLEALRDEKVVAALKITGPQQEKMQTVRDSMRERMQEIFASAGGDRDKMREAFEEVREGIEKDTLAVLNANQKKEFEEMKGEPFEFPEAARGGGFGRGGRGGPGGGGGPGFGGRGGRGGDGGRGDGGRRQRPSADE